jgi:hypothetical protein
MTADTRDLSILHRVLHATDNDIEEFLSFFTDTSQFRMGNAEAVIGRQAITQWVSGFLSAVVGTTHEVITIWEADDSFAVRMDVTYRMQSGQRFTLPAVTEMRFAGNYLTHYLIYMDPSPIVGGS